MNSQKRDNVTKLENVQNGQKPENKIMLNLVV